MELRHLRYFEAVAAERNFTRAAQRVGVAQPPLSRQMRELEAEVGLELFDRASRPIRLTEAGRLFYVQAVQILSSVEQLKRSMDRFAEVGRGRFVIGVVGSIVYGPMPKIVRGFRAAAPHVDVQLAELTTLEQVAALKEGRIDVGLGRIRVDDPAIRREVLHNEPLVAALSADHPRLATASSLRLADLVGLTLIVYPSRPRPSYADQVLSLMRDHGVSPERVTEVREVQTALGLVAAETGVAIVPASMRKMQSDDIVYVPIADPGATSPIILSHRLGDPSPEIAEFERAGRNAF